MSSILLCLLRPYTDQGRTNYELGMLCIYSDGNKFYTYPLDRWYVDPDGQLVGTLEGSKLSLGSSMQVVSPIHLGTNP